jgi:hypothetical protein
MTRGGEPDVEISAGATADELRMTRRPEIVLRAGENQSERDRLPRPVPVGVPFRHVRVAMRTFSRLQARVSPPPRGRRSA